MPAGATGTDLHAHHSKVRGARKGGVGRGGAALDMNYGEGVVGDGKVANLAKW